MAPGASRMVVGVCALALATAALGCAHGGAPAPAGPGRTLATAAARIGGIAYEDDFLEARLVLQALPLSAPERAPLRAKLLHYLLDPVLTLKLDDVRRQTRELESDDLYDTVFESFRDALGLFDPAEISIAPARVTPDEARLLRPAAELVLGLYSPRGGDQQVTLALVALATLAPDAHAGQEWSSRLDQVVGWTDEQSDFDEGSSMHKASSAIDALESALGDWPAPPVVSRLDALYVARQTRFASALHHPPSGDSARRALGELLLAHGDEMQRAVTSMAGAYLRAGRLADAASRTARMAGEDGDDPELRGLLVAAAKPDAAPADTLTLARRFLPRVDFLGGTATDAPDPVVALRVLEAGLQHHPADADLLVLSGHVARLLSSYFLALLRLEQAEAVLAGNPAQRELLGRISAELIELGFVRLRLRLDPERDAPAYAEADDLRRRFVETKQRFAGTELKVRDSDIDFELARSYVNAGLIDRAEPLFLRARDEGEPTAEVTIELANLALKRGDPARAGQIVREGIDVLRGKGTTQDTIGSVAGRARLDRLLGATCDAGGDRAGASVACSTCWAAAPRRCRDSTTPSKKTGIAISRTSTSSRSWCRPARPTRRSASIIARWRARAARSPSTSRSTPRCGSSISPAARPRSPIRRRRRTCARWTSATASCARTAAHPGTTCSAATPSARFPTNRFSPPPTRPASGPRSIFTRRCGASATASPTTRTSSGRRSSRRACSRSSSSTWPPAT